jgi:glutathione S-transferase
MTLPTLDFYHAPNSRSAGVRILLEELGATYELHPIRFAKGDHQQPAFLAINPLGKVPAVVHGGSVITEQSALYTYLADYFADAGLAPGLRDPDRGPFLRWMAFYGSCFEPALVNHYLKNEPGSHAMSPYGSYDEVINTLDAQLSTGPYLLGERFSAADVLWGTALEWTVGFKLVPERPVFTAYIKRIAERPAALRAKALDEALVAQLAD